MLYRLITSIARTDADGWLWCCTAAQHQEGWRPGNSDEWIEVVW